MNWNWNDKQRQTHRRAPPLAERSTAGVRRQITFHPQHPTKLLSCTAIVEQVMWYNRPHTILRMSAEVLVIRHSFVILVTCYIHSKITHTTHWRSFRAICCLEMVVLCWLESASGLFSLIAMQCTDIRRKLIRYYHIMRVDSAANKCNSQETINSILSVHIRVICAPVVCYSYTVLSAWWSMDFRWVWVCVWHFALLTETQRLALHCGPMRSDKLVFLSCCSSMCIECRSWRSTNSSFIIKILYKLL